jgi:hypothetical protein
MYLDCFVHVDEEAGCIIVWETDLSSRIVGFLFAISNCTDGFMRLSYKEIKLEMNVIATVT